MKGYVYNLTENDVISHLDMHRSFYADCLPRIGETMMVGSGINNGDQNWYRVIDIIYHDSFMNEVYVIVEALK